MLPREITADLERTLVRSRDPGELQRALAAVVVVFTTELERTEPVLADRLRPVLAELVTLLATTRE